MMVCSQKHSNKVTTHPGVALNDAFSWDSVQEVLHCAGLRYDQGLVLS